MYKELDKYVVDDCFKKPEPMQGAYVDDDTRVNEYIIYKVGLGDLINDYLALKKKPFWKRKIYHKHLEEIYIKMINRFNIKYKI